MTEQQATLVAKAIGGEVWESEGDKHIVAIRRPDDGLVVFSTDLISEYDDEVAFENAMPSTTILVRTDPTEYWVIECENGDVWLDDPEHGRGWASEDEAQEEAHGIQSRVGRCWVRQQRVSDVNGK